MQTGDFYTHKYDPAFTCEIVRETTRGAEVTIYKNGKKPKRMFFDRDTFSDHSRGHELWIKTDKPPKQDKPRSPGGRPKPPVHTERPGLLFGGSEQTNLIDLYNNTPPTLKA